MNENDQTKKTYRLLNDWRSFQLKLFAESIVIGILTGTIVGSFRYILQFAESHRSHIYQFLLTHHVIYTMGWLLFLMVIAYLLYLLVKYEPLASGSGIPQVKGAILGFTKMRWFPILWTKLTGGILGIGAGLSLGREGPSIQVGAVIGQGLSRLMQRTRIEERYLLTSGASAGLATAFNAPLAGVIFALEELHRNFSVVVLLPAMGAALTATVVAREFLGSEPIFDFVGLPILPISYYGYVILLGIIVGIVGALFNYGLIKAGDFYKLPCFKNNFIRIGFALLFAAAFGFILPEVLGGGNDLVNTLVKQPTTIQFLLLLFVVKFLFTMISYGSGAPGGFFLPMLVIGALTGSVVAQLLITNNYLPELFRTNILVIAMAGFFASSVRAPITGTILVMEMTGSFQHMMVLIIASVVAFITAEICRSRPIYEELLQRSLSAIKKSPFHDNVVLSYERNIMELAVCSGSTLDGSRIKDVAWPEHTLLVDVKRGTTDSIPNGDTRLRAGDYLYILTDTVHSGEVRELSDELHPKKV